jgi:hypothetical protein
VSNNELEKLKRVERFFRLCEKYLTKPPPAPHGDKRYPIVGGHHDGCRTDRTEDTLKIQRAPILNADLTAFDDSREYPTEQYHFETIRCNDSLIIEFYRHESITRSQAIESLTGGYRKSPAWIDLISSIAAEIKSLYEAVQ